MSVIFMRGGVETPAEIVLERDGGYVDLMVEGPDGDGNDPHKMTMVPYWKRQEQSTQKERIGGKIVDTPVTIDVESREGTWREA